MVIWTKTNAAKMLKQQQLDEPRYLYSLYIGKRLLQESHMLALEKGVDMSVLVRFLLTELVRGRIQLPANIGDRRAATSVPVQASKRQ
jgi:hypothetical protein